MMDLRKNVRTTIHRDKSAERLEVDRTGGEGVTRFLNSLDEPLIHASTMPGMGGNEMKSYLIPRWVDHPVTLLILDVGMPC